MVSATITLGKELDSAFFSVLGETLASLVILVWLIVMLKTVHKAWTGALFPTPGQLEVRPKQVEKVRYWHYLVFFTGLC